MNKTRVLFLCTGNSARSQMSEAFLRRLGGEAYEVYSAGLELAPRVNPLAIRAMAELGYDLSAHYVKHLDTYAGKIEFDYLITVCGHAEETCPFFPGQGQRLHWPFDDPAAFEGDEDAKMAKFREVRDQIRARIEGWLVEGAPGGSPSMFSLTPGE